MFMLSCAPFGSLAESLFVPIVNLLLVQRVCGRAVVCTGLENRRGEIHREFESHRTRQIESALSGVFFRPEFLSGKLLCPSFGK